MNLLRALSILLAALLLSVAPANAQDAVERALEQMQQMESRTAEQNERLDALLEQRRSEIATRSSNAAERITRYTTDIEVETSGDIVITETIDVVAAGRQIKRGIFRELPRYYDFQGVRQAYDYDVISVLRDGAPDGTAYINNGNALLIRIGRGDVMLEPGPYRYEIKYRVGDAVIRHEDFDELYWNATGTYWDFPIERARATVRWPDGTQIRELNSYVGRFNSDTGASTERREGLTAVFETTAPLPSKAGLTISAIVEKGVIAPWSDARLRQLAWIRNGAVTMLSLGGLGLLGYYGLMWTRVGRDPQKPPVFPRYEPPEGYGPAAVHYIHHRTHKGMTGISAQLLHMGARGEARITAEDGVTKIERLSEPAHPDSKELFEYMLPFRSETLVMDGSEDGSLYRGTSTYLRKIAERYSKDYYRRNLGLAFLGMLASVALVFFVFVSNVSLAGPVVIALLLALVGLNILFLKLLPAPTNKGSKVSAEIEGFKLYLETAEKGRINTGGPLQERPPAMSVKLYERFLPYAVALGVEKPWTRYFETVMPQEAREYRPNYGRGSGFAPGRSGRAPVQFGKTMTKALTSGVAAAAPVSRSTSSGSFGSSSSSGSGWSSGGGGGGFSGGGGGGGGGGGW